MDVCYPALTTAALFFTFIVVDLIRRNYKAMGSHFLLGTIAIILMLYLCQSGAEVVAWGLLALPIIFLILGFTVGALKPAPGPTVTPAVTLLTAAPVAKHCYQCGQHQCVCPTQLPSPSATGAIHDTSGNVVIPAAASAVPTHIAPTTTSCGPDSNSGKTQCIDTRSLASA